jgi:hypothetical protein
MGSIALYRGFHLVRRSTDAPAGAHEGIFRRIFTAIERLRRRNAEREVARFIAAHGARITDDVERQLMERFSDPGFRP